MTIERPLTQPGDWDTLGSTETSMAHRWDRTLADFFNQYLRPAKGARVFEVGCAPGKWMAHFNETYGCRVAGCDYSALGMERTRQSLQRKGIQADLWEGDFNRIDFGQETFDIVLSLGFIEHFSNPWPVLEKHRQLLAPGGSLAIEVPNFRGINGWLQDQDLLNKHNTDVMTRSFFRSVSDRLGLTEYRVAYIGGFEPANILLERARLPRRLLGKVCGGLRRLDPRGVVNSRWWSAYLVGIFHNPSRSIKETRRPL